ncbi:MAG: bifunctional hydroxymethylpyrimidine kinase/phosphomethylpyrimidine kinase [Bacteroidia bacterium]|nr:bifunctional hydroxymethylpyrimidine kinase/phosphomethylpyrimidine kinase [Bacteroidia bacterium]MDW8088914.1 bifunctional hydroxymethylpyrimidine kinase/phosphomethylpyrimidine kinase [Bacteroidia bacterium]
MKLVPVLTIAGSDSSGGAGIQADLKAFTVLGVYGMSVLTALTAQNTQAVYEVFPLAPSFVRAQLEAVFADIPPKAIKTGMLAEAGIIAEVARFLAREAPSTPYVCDPVMVATSGAPLLNPEAETALRHFCAEATIATPNLLEAALLAGEAVPTNETEFYHLGERLSRTYPKPYWLIKGGHATWEKSSLTNLLFKEGQLVQRVVQPRLSLARPPHGTGCTLASAIAARLAQGAQLVVAVEEALYFVHKALAETDPSLGKAALVLNPYAAYAPQPFTP